MQPISSSRPDNLADRAAAVLAGGATHIARSYLPPLFVTRAAGSRKWVDGGRELVDYTMGHGALLLGHAHPAIVAAVTRQAQHGTHYGAGHAGEVEWAERIVHLVPSVDLVRFTNSGTEATMLAIRLARAATGREVLVKVADHFHGWHDAVSVEVDERGDPWVPPGVPRALGPLTRAIDPDDPAALDAALDDRRVAAVIVEASGAHYGRTPLPQGWVERARAVCDRTGTLLIIDEVVTGFRVRVGGMQELLSVGADLSCYAKVVAGGLPGGAVGGRAEVMDQLEVRDGAARVTHPGTYNANPLSAAAGCAMLDLVADGEAQRRAAATASQLEAIWIDRMAAAGIPGRAWRLESIVHARLDDPAAQARLSGALRDAGVDLLRTSAFVSAVHDDADLEITATAIDIALRRAVAAGP